MQVAATNSMAELGEVDDSLEKVRQDLLDLEVAMFGNRAKRVIGEKTLHPIGERLMFIMIGFSKSTYGPTANHEASLSVVNEQLNEIKPRLEASKNSLDELSRLLKEKGAPWVEGDDLWKE